MLFEQDHRRTLEVELLLATDVTLLLAAAVIEPLRAANRLAGRAVFALRISSFDGAPVRTASGVEIAVAGRFEPAARTAPLFVAASYDEPRHVGRAELARIAAAARRRAALVGLEAGAWSLARAGALRGRAATTHWEDLEAFAAAFPDIDVRGDRAVIDGARITAGGSAPTLDLMLEIVRARAGADLARSVSRLFLYERAGRSSDRQVAGPPATAFDPRVAAAVEIMESAVADPEPVSRIARRVGVGPRRLRSLFLEAVGAAPSAYYRGVRLDAARRLLMETRLSAQDVGHRCGFASPAAFSRAYRGRHGETPSETRQSARR